ncbi:MAG: hypothetical protein LQ351_005037 [Letrouitia transgressa]|nr:MAG: hypothetical protein LQ351_005037 [Letrouitia transgressa]
MEFWLQGLRQPHSRPHPYPCLPLSIGDNGPWSTFSFRAGTPAQDVRLLVSTASQVSWLVLEGRGCRLNDETCAQSRGGLYNSNTSSTWSPKGLYQLYNGRNLGIEAVGLFGNETLALGLPGSGGPTLEKQIIAGIGNEAFYLGMFGVNPKRTNYTGIADEGQASIMTSLKDQNLIPSISFGYTAGAQYRLKKVLGSLTLGGYDQSRFIPNDMSFSFAPDTDRDLVIGIQKIVSTDKDGKSHNLLPSGINAYIDSTVPEIWLPLEACKAFEDAFGLTYDAENEFYPVSDNLHNKLLDRNASISFTIGNTNVGGKTTEIVLPYDSFDLQARRPFSPNGTKYFPIRRADNDTQFTLGRTFLQESYLIVDWERANFSVSQCLFDSDNMNQKLVPINSVNTTSNATVTTGNKKSSNTGEIIGIAVGVAVALVLIAACSITFFLLKRRKNRHHKEEEKPKEEEDDESEKVRQGYAKAELNTGFDNTRFELGGPEDPTLAKPPAAWVNEKASYPGEHAELVGDKALSELTGGGIAASELATQKGISGRYHEMYDPSTMQAAVELPADLPRELLGSSPTLSSRASSSSSPMFRSTNPSPMNRSGGTSPYNRPQGGRSPINRLSGRTSGSGSVEAGSPRSRHFGPSPTPRSSRGPSSPSRSGTTSSKGNEMLSPISPMAGSEEGSNPQNLFSMVRGLNPFTHPPPYNRSTDDAARRVSR